MELRAGRSASAPLLLLFIFCHWANSQDDSSIMENDQSRKLLGSSVVTSVSVIMEHGNGSKTVIKDGGGAKPQIVGTPGSFLSPDRYEFYSLDDSGDLVKRLMSLEEIQSLIAASRPELAAPSIPVYYHRPLVEPDIADEGVQNVLANVQSVLREELAKEREPPKPQPLPIDDSWSLLLPGLFGADLDYKQEPMLSRPVKPTTVGFPESRPTAFPTTNKEPTYAEVSQGTTFAVLPPITNPPTSPKPEAPSTPKPIKYSSHYTTAPAPLIDKLPDITVPPIPPSTKPPKQSPTTDKPSTVIHYLPIQSISPSTSHHSQKPFSNQDKNKNEFTTLPPVKKTTPVKVPSKTVSTTVKPVTLEYNYYNKTYQRITAKPDVNNRPNLQTNKPVKPTNNIPAKPYPTYPSTITTQYSTAKPYIKSTHKPEIKPFTEYQIVETIATRKPPVTISPASTAKRPSPTKPNQSFVNNKLQNNKPSSSYKPQQTTRPVTQPTTEKSPPKQSKPTSPNKYHTSSLNHKTGVPGKPTSKPSTSPTKFTPEISSNKIINTTKMPPANKPPVKVTNIPTKTTTSEKITTTTSSDNLVETIELVPITQDDELMASSAAALIQDLLRTETNKDHFTKPTSFSTMTGGLITSNLPSTTYPSSVKTQGTTFTVSKPTNKPYQITKQPSNTFPTTEKLKTTTKATTVKPFIQNTTKATSTTAQKPISNTNYRPINKKPTTQSSFKPTNTINPTIKPTANVESQEKLSSVQSEALTQSSPPQKLESQPVTKKPTEIKVIPINDLKKYSSLNQLISAKPDIISNRTTLHTTKFPTTLPATTIKNTNPIPTTSKHTEYASTAFTSTFPTTTKQKHTETVPTTTIPTTIYTETEKLPSSDYINSDMIYQVISTLQSNENKITYPTTIGEFITSTLRTFTTEQTTPGSTIIGNSEPTTEAITDTVKIVQKNNQKENDKFNPSEKVPLKPQTHSDVELISESLLKTVPERIVSGKPGKPYLPVTKPLNLQTQKYQEKIETTTYSDEERFTQSTQSYTTTQTTESEVTATEESTSDISTKLEDTTTVKTNQETTTNIFDDQAIQEGISAVANILLDDPNMMRHLAKPGIEALTTTDSIDDGTISTITTESLDSTTDLNLLRLEMGTDNYDPTDSSTTMDSVTVTTSDTTLPTTTTVTLKSGLKEAVGDLQNDDPESTTLLLPTEATTTLKSQIKQTVFKNKTNLTPTKESKLDDSQASDMTKLFSSASSQPIVKSNATKPVKQSSLKPSNNKPTYSRPNKVPVSKPSKIPSDKPTRPPFKPNNNNKTATTTANVNSTNPVKVELKNALNDKFFKKPGINSYQPNVQPPPAIDLHPAPQESLGLEASTAFLQEDIKKFSDLLNEIGFRLWTSISGKGGISSRSFVLSPFAATSMLAMVFLGARGPTSGQMNDILRLDDMVTFNPHQVLKNVTESVINSKNLGVATASFVRELYSDKFKGKILDFYKERVHQYYDGHVEEVNFNAIGDIVRRRTNLLVKRQTLGKLPEYLRGSSLNMRPPLAAFTANIFQSDCEAASTEGRDGEMYFVVRPSTRQRRLVPVPAVVWRSSFLAGYEPSLDATSVCLGADSVVSTILVLPGQQGQVAPGDGLARLEQRLIETSFRRGGWSKLLRSLLPRPGLELQLPRFSHRSVLNITQALRHMGLKDLFTARADLRGLNGVSNDLHLSDMVQVNTFSTCGEEKVGARHHTETYPSSAIRIGRKDEEEGIRKRQARSEGEGTVIRRQRQARITEDWLPIWRRKRSLGEEEELYREFSEEETQIPQENQRSLFDEWSDEPLSIFRDSKQLRLATATETPRLRFDRPFLYMIRHNPTGIILHMGRFNPRLLP